MRAPRRNGLLFACIAVALVMVCVPARLRAEPKRPRPTAQSAEGIPDKTEGAEILRQMRRTFLAEDAYLEFELKVMPRRGDETRSEGRLWSSRNGEGPMMRLHLDDATFLVQSGPRPMAWRWSDRERSGATTLDISRWFAPLAESDLSVFDVQMPFLFWDDCVYEGPSRVSGRMVETFLAKPPPEFAAQHPELTAIRFRIDRTYHALLLAEHLGKDSVVTKTFRLIGLKRAGDRYTMKAVEIRDEATRRKTRLTVGEARIGVPWPAIMFSPDHLATEPAKP